MNASIEIVNSKEEYFNALIEIQKIILEDNKYEDIITFITETKILTNKNLFLHLLQIIKKSIFIRPKKLDLLISIITYLKEPIQKEFPHFRWIGSHIPPYFLDELKKIGVFTIPIRQLKNPDEDLYKQLIESLKSDDISSFQSTLSHSNININTQINYRYYKLDKSLNPTLIELSALFGSIKIFKFLLMNNAMKRNILANYALAGGNYEIIHILERENISFTDIEVISEAIRFQRNDVVEYLEPEAFDAFVYSVRYDNIECFVKFLNKIDVNQAEKFLSENPDLLKICFHSVKKNLIEITKILCCLIPDCVNKAEINYQFMIHCALKNNFDDISKFLINYDKSDLNITNGESETPLFLAVRSKNIEIIELLCRKEKVDLNAQNFQGDTALSLALIEPSVQIIEIFIKHKNKLNTVIKNNKQLTYMNLAIMTKNLEIVKLINGFDEKLRLIENKTKATPLIYAVGYGTLEIVEFLCSFDDVKVNAKNCHGISSLHLAIERPEILSFLCKIPKIDLNIRNDQGNSPLHLAASKGKIDSVRILLSLNEIDINALNCINETPLFLAVTCGYLNIVKILCDQKAIDISIKNNKEISKFFIFLKQSFTLLLNRITWK